MAQAGYTPIQLYLSTTASAVPSAGNLANGELAINITDGKLFYKDNGGVVQVLATKGAGTIGGSNTQVQYNSSGALAGSANLTFDGTTLTAAGLAGPHNGTVGATTPNTGAFTTLAASGAVTLSGGTANGVPYLNGSKVLTTGSALTFDGTTFNVGGRIGFSAFSSEVDNFALYVSSATSATTLTSFSTNPIAFRVNNAEQMRLTSTGLGIGTSSPSAKLHVEGNVLCSAGNIFTSINSGIFFSGTPNVYTSGIYSVNTLDVAINTNGVERARINSSGNFLIGATSGSTKFGVFGVETTYYNTATFGNGSENQFLDIMCGRALTNGTGGGVASSTVMTLRSSGTAAGVIAFATGNNERFRVDSAGNFMVGKVDPGYDANGCALLPSGQIRGTSNNDYPLLLLRNGSDGIISSFWRGGIGPVGTISITTTSTSYNTSSDYRLKENVQPMTGALARVSLLKPVTYTWKADGSAGEGFIAHELAEVCPAAVSGEKDAVDAEGNPQYQGIDVSFLVGTLTAAIQEQQALIQTLTARVAALESN